MPSTVVSSDIVILDSFSSSMSAPFNNSSPSKASNVIAAATCRHGQQRQHKSCNLCQRGRYCIQQQNRLNIQFDRLENVLNSLEHQSPAASSLVNANNNDNEANIVAAPAVNPSALLRLSDDGRPVTLLSATSFHQPTSPSSHAPLKSQLRVVQEYTNDLLLSSSPAPTSESYIHQNALKRSMKLNLNNNQNREQPLSPQLSSVEIESARLHDRSAYGLKSGSSRNKKAPLKQPVWEPPKRVVYPKGEFSNGGEGLQRFSRLAKSPAPRRLSAKLVQIEMNLQPTVLPVSTAPGSNNGNNNNNQPRAQQQQNVPACYMLKTGNMHDIAPHNPYINYFKLKQMVSEGKLKLKNIPSFEWPRIFQQPTSTVMAGEGDTAFVESLSRSSTGVSTILPQINRGEFVSNWVRKSEMQPLAKFNQLQLEGLGAGCDAYQLMQMPATPGAGVPVSYSPDLAGNSSNGSPQMPITNSFTARNSSFVKRSSQSDKRVKAQTGEVEVLAA